MPSVLLWVLAVHPWSRFLLMCLRKSRWPTCLGPGIHTGNPDEAPGWPSTVVSAICRVNQQKKDLSTYNCLSAKTEMKGREGKRWRGKKRENSIKPLCEFHNQNRSLPYPISLYKPRWSFFLTTIITGETSFPSSVPRVYFSIILKSGGL